MEWLDQLHRKAHQVSKRIAQNKNQDARVEKEKLILTPLEKIELPPGVREARTDLVRLFPSVGLPEVLLDVEHWAHYTKELTHLTGRRASSAEREAATRPAVFAVLVAEATNIGLAAMANSSGIALHELEAVYDWYFREETLRASIQHLISYRRTLPLTSSFGDGTTSFSDGIRFGMAASDLHARHLPRYFGMRRGVTCKFWNCLSENLVITWLIRLLSHNDIMLHGRSQGLHKFLEWYDSDQQTSAEPVPLSHWF